MDSFNQMHAYACTDTLHAGQCQVSHVRDINGKCTLT